MHIKKPVIFKEIGKPCVTLKIQNSGILAILGYSEPWQFKTDTYSKFSQGFKIECFANIVIAISYSYSYKAVIIFLKRSILDL